jgi:hypothetical protein
MSDRNGSQSVRHVVHISTNHLKPCEHCEAMIGLENWAESVNHYVDQHGYTVLHVGTETTHDQEGRPWHATVAVVGK